MARRSVGTISYLEEKKLWRARATVTDSLGNRVRRDWYGKTQDEARQKMTEAQYQSDRGQWSATKTPTVEVWLDEWLPTLTLKPTTVAKYRESVELHIKPNLGKQQLSNLKPSSINAFQAKLKRDGLAPATVQRVKVVLGRALHAAVNDDLIARNVVTLADAVKQNPKEQEVITPAQQQKLFESARDHEDLPLWRVLSMTGLRISEALGLKWSDIDFSNKIIKVRQQLIAEGGQWQATTLKTQYSRRNIPMSDEVYVILTGLKFLAKKSPYVFTSVSRFTLLRRFQAALVKAGLAQYDLHSFRHSFGSILLAKGVPLPEVSKLMGHASTAITARVYAHQLDQNSRRGAEVMNSVFGSVFSHSEDS